MKKFEALETAVTTNVELRPLVETIARKDKDLSVQLRRAGTSVVSNLGEGNERIAGDRLHCWRIAKGSAREMRLQLTIAVAWGYIDADRAQAVDALADRVCAMLHRLTT